MADKLSLSLGALSSFVSRSASCRGRCASPLPHPLQRSSWPRNARRGWPTRKAVLRRPAPARTRPYAFPFPFLPSPSSPLVLLPVDACANVLLCIALVALRRLLVAHGALEARQQGGAQEAAQRRPQARTESHGRHREIRQGRKGRQAAVQGPSAPHERPTLLQAVRPLLSSSHVASLTRIGRGW